MTLYIYYKENTKLYYFWPLDQYAQNLETQEVHSIKPEDNFVPKPKKLSYYEKNSNISKEKQEKELKKHREKLLEKQKQEKNNSLKNKLEELKTSAKEFKKSEEFKTKKEEIKDQILNLPKEEFVINNLDTSFATWYNPPANSSNVFIPWLYAYPNDNCWWKVPCYWQFETTYDWENCAVWCWPVAWWMIYWYYDRNWYFPDLMPWWSAPTINDTEVENTPINNIIKFIGDYYVSTKCNSEWNWAWSTSLGNFLNWIDYAIDRWYTSSSANLTYNDNTSILFNVIKYEIYNWRPIVVNTKKHIMVAFWYYDWWQKIVRINLWYWNNHKFNNNYYSSNIDYNIDSIYYNWSSKPLKSVVRVNISN